MKCVENFCAKKSSTFLSLLLQSWEKKPFQVVPFTPTLLNNKKSIRYHTQHSHSLRSSLRTSTQFRIKHALDISWRPLFPETNSGRSHAYLFSHLPPANFENDSTLFVSEVPFKHSSTWKSVWLRNFLCKSSVFTLLPEMILFPFKFRREVFDLICMETL